MAALSQAGWAGALLAVHTLKRMCDQQTNRPIQWLIGHVARDKHHFGDQNKLQIVLSGISIH